MNGMNYAGLDIHKKSISCCVRQADGTIMQEGTIPATRDALDNWMKQLPQPWMAGIGKGSHLLAELPLRKFSQALMTSSEILHEPPEILEILQRSLPQG